MRFPSPEQRSEEGRNIKDRRKCFSLGVLIQLKVTSYSFLFLFIILAAVPGGSMRLELDILSGTPIAFIFDLKFMHLKF